MAFSSPTTFLGPRITEAPSEQPCLPNRVVVQLATSVVIPEYSLFYSSPILAFEPSYQVHADGSLLTPPFQQDLINANLSLLVTGALAMLFLRNIIVSADYLRRGKVKRKMLFYALIMSQLLSPVALVPLLLSYFTTKISCDLVVILSCAAATASFALLITIILGTKIYRCMNSPKWIAIVLGLFQLGSTIIIIFDIISTQGLRRLTGSCVRNNELRFIRYFATVQFMESLFICCCFLYICWRSRDSPTVRGRISIELSMYDTSAGSPHDNTKAAKRGWWDYVPENYVPPPVEPNEGNPGLMSKVLGRFRGPKQEPKFDSILEEKGVSPISEPGEVKLQNRYSIAQSLRSNIGRFMPPVTLFQQVMKDELFYTTFITFSCVLAAVFSVIGLNSDNGLSVTGWIALNWAIVSLLSIHSFGRVVHRHERDALLNHPTTCAAIMRTAADLVKNGPGRDTIPSDLSDRQRSPQREGFHTSQISNPFEDPSADPQRREDPFASRLDDQIGIRENQMWTYRSSGMINMESQFDRLQPGHHSNYRDSKVSSIQSSTPGTPVVAVAQRATLSRSLFSGVGSIPSSASHYSLDSDSNPYDGITTTRREPGR